MTETLLFTDGSVHTQSGIGYGAYLKVEDPVLSLETHRENIRTQRFEPTSSTKLELQTLLWALKEVSEKDAKVIVHTDSQNILSLLRRRDRLEKNEFRSKQGRLLNNYELYQEFYNQIDKIDCAFVKVKGHPQSSEKDTIDHLFTLVDRASRNALRSAL